MNDNTVSDACLEFVPLTTADRAEQQSISLLIGGEKVPNIRRMVVSAHELDFSMMPCRAVGRIKELAKILVRVPILYTCRKTVLSGEGIVLFVGETIAWPAGIAEVSVRIGIDEGWTKEAP